MQSKKEGEGEWGEVSETTLKLIRKSWQRRLRKAGEAPDESAGLTVEDTHTVYACADVLQVGRGCQDSQAERGPGQWAGSDHLVSLRSRTVSPSLGETVAQSPLVGKASAFSVSNHRKKEYSSQSLAHRKCHSSIRHMEGCD